MKSKIILILFLFTGLSFSCNQDESPKTSSEYFLKFKVNNANVNFPGNPSQPATFFYDSNGDVYAGIIQGFAREVTEPKMPFKYPFIMKKNLKSIKPMNCKTQFFIIHQQFQGSL
jgi:hypothetical protein